MPSIWKLLPATLCDLWFVSPYRDARDGDDSKARHAQALRELEAWARDSLMLGEIFATGYAMHAAADAKPIRLEPRRWVALRFDSQRNCAVDAITGDVVLTGLDFEWAAPEPHGTAASDPGAVADEYIARGEYPTRDRFRKACLGAKAEAVERAWTIKIKPFRSGSHGRKSAETGRNGKALPAS